MRILWRSWASVMAGKVMMTLHDVSSAVRKLRRCVWRKAGVNKKCGNEKTFTKIAGVSDSLARG